MASGFPWSRGLIFSWLLGLLPSFGAPARAIAQDVNGVWVAHPPFERSDAASVYDPVRQRLLVFGGCDEALSYDGVWALSLSGERRWTRLDPLGPSPGPRNGHSAVYDPIRDRVLIFGGQTDRITDPPLGDVWALSLSGVPTWSQLTVSGESPAGRVLHRAIYDPGGDRMIVIGGYDSYSALSDVWSLSLGDDPQWMRLDPSGESFIGRYGPGAILDPARDRIVVFGGYGGFNVGYLDDVWELSLGANPGWSRLPTSGLSPGPLSNQVTVYDAAGDRMMVYGGYSNGVFHDDTWELSLAGTPTWSLVTTSGARPRGRNGCAAIVDPARHELVLFGGSADGVVYGELWTLDLDAMVCWQDRTPVPAGPPRGGSPAGIYDPVRQALWLYGGDPEQGPWRLALDGPFAWSRVPTVGDAPPARGGHGLIYDPMGDRMILFGGVTRGLRFNDVWSMTLGGKPRWTRIVPRGVPPAPRSWPLAVYDPVRRRMLVLGGQDSTGDLLGDLWALSLGPEPKWETIVPSGTPPSPLQGEAAAYDPEGDRLMLYGGIGPAGFTDELWALSLSGVPTWSTIPANGPTPGPRFFPAMVPDPDRHRLVLYGGADGSTIRSDVWALDSGDPRWVPLEPAGSPPRRFWCVAISDVAHGRMVIQGGTTLGGAAPVAMKDTWTLEWGKVLEAPLPAPSPFACCGSLSLAVDPPHPSVGPVRLRFTLPEPAHVRLAVYDVGGRLVHLLLEGELAAGGHRVEWDRDGAGSRVGAGVYLCQLVAGSRRETIRLVLLR